MKCLVKQYFVLAAPKFVKESYDLIYFFLTYLDLFIMHLLVLGSRSVKKKKKNIIRYGLFYIKIYNECNNDPDENEKRQGRELCSTWDE